MREDHGAEKRSAAVRPDDRQAEDRLITELKAVMQDSVRGEPLDPAVLHQWVEADHARKRRRLQRCACAACVVLLLFAGVLGMRTWVLHTELTASAGKGEQHAAEVHGDVMIKNSDIDPSQNIGLKTVTCDTWDAVRLAKKTYPDLLLPGYIPEGYAFEKLEIEDTGLTEKYVFSYIKGEAWLEIQEYKGSELTILDKYTRKWDAEGETIYLKDDHNKTAWIKRGDLEIGVLGDFPDDIFERMLLSLK